MPNDNNQLNLVNLFKSVASSLSAQKEALNSADTINHDHGNNMVEVFNVISQAMQTKQGADPADQLEYASQLLRQRKSGSAQVYAQGLSQASKEFKNQGMVTPDNVINLIQAFMGGGQASTLQPQDGTGSLLQSLIGDGKATSQEPQGGISDLLGQLMNNIPAQSQPQGQSGTPNLDLGDLLNAGMAFMNTKNQGGNNLEAIVNALVSGSAMANSGHRSQSGALVANSFLQAIGSSLEQGGKMGKSGWSQK